MCKSEFSKMAPGWKGRRDLDESLCLRPRASACEQMRQQARTDSSSCVSAVRWSSRPTGRSAFHLARGRGTLFIADAHYFCLDEMTPGARLVQVDQHLPTVVVAYAGYVGRVALQGRNKLSGMIELVEHVIARCRVCAQTAYGASFLELGVKVSQIRNCYVQVRSRASQHSLLV